MKSRFSTVAGILTAATLLSGSAFAFAPEFTGDLPTVIITDRISEGSVSAPAVPDFDAPNGDWSGDAGFDGFRASSAFLFRYDDAVDLTPIIQLNDAAAIGDVKVVFNEFDDISDLTPNATTTLSINGTDALASVPVKGDFSGGNSFTAGLLSFRNIDFSPGTGLGPFDPVGDVTGDDLRISDTQSRVVSLYIDTVDSTTGGGDSISLDVITTIDDLGDRTSATVSTDPFVPFWDTTGGLNGWVVRLSDNQIKGIADNGPAGSSSSGDASSPSLAGFAITPAPADLNLGTAVPDSAGPVTVTSTNAQVGLMGVGVPATTLALSADSLYRMRVNWQSANAATNASIFIQWGDIFSTGAINSGLSDPGAYTEGTRLAPKLGTAASDFDSYLLTKGSGTTGFSISLIDTNASDGNEVAINSVEFSESTRSALGSGTVLRNEGAASFATAAGEPTVVSASQAAFTPGTLVGTLGEIGASAGLNAALPQTMTPTASALTAQIGPSPSATTDYEEFVEFGYAGANFVDLDTMSTGLDLDPSKIYIMDVWASTNSAGQTHPNLLPRMTADGTYFAAAGYWTGADGGIGLVQPEVQLAADAKLYSVVFKPQTPNAAAVTFLNVSFLWAGGNGAFGTLDNTTTTIHRIILTEY